MEASHPKLFNSLEKILKRTNLTEKTLPVNLEQWQKFVERINNIFYDLEQERYLLERSMEISSREMVELNEKFLIAQDIAHIGYWFYNPKENKILWSKETYRQFGLDPSLPVPTFEKVMEMVDERDRPKLMQLVDQALSEGKNYELNIRIHNAADKKIYWTYVKGHPYKPKNQENNPEAKYLLSGISMDITEQILAEKRFEKILEATPDAIVIINQDGEINFINSQTEKLFGYEKNELIGQSVDTLIPEPYRSKHPHHRIDFFKNPRTRQMGTGMQLFGLRKNSEIFPLEISLSPLETKEGVFALASIRDITERKLAEDNLKTLNQQLVSLSRQAGMSEIATSVLHNIGNILNSVNISVSSIHELISNSDVNGLIKVSKMITDNLPKKPNYLLTDTRGKLIPEYLTCLSESLIEEYEQIKKETNLLIEGINHIKDIVSMQKDISGVGGIKEKILIPEIMDLAIQMACASPEKHGITLIKKYEYRSFIITDKAKLLQILVNLIKNAKDSLSLSEANNQRMIVLSITKDNSSIKMTVHDNGMGIPKKDLTKIFSMGYTTKREGHGFGLHSSAIAANELSGNLIAESEGKGKGASFILTLPISAGGGALVG